MIKNVSSNGNHKDASNENYNEKWNATSDDYCENENSNVKSRKSNNEMLGK